MTREELEQKVINAEATVAKRRETLRKHREQLERKIEKGAEPWEIEIKRDDIKCAEGKLEEAKRTLQNWRDKLGERVSRDAFIEANTPEVMKDFLEQWKAATLEHYRKARLDWLAARDELRAQERQARLEALHTLPELEEARQRYGSRDLSDFELINLRPSKPVEDFLKERHLSRRDIRQRLEGMADMVIRRLVEIRDDTEREAWLEKTIEAEKKARLADMITRINKVVGTILDASDLHMSNGEINGTVAGTEGRAKVQTIGAGGYNIQRFHFRTLVHELK